MQVNGPVTLKRQRKQYKGVKSPEEHEEGGGGKRKLELIS